MVGSGTPASLALVVSPRATTSFLVSPLSLAISKG